MTALNWQLEELIHINLNGAFLRLELNENTIRFTKGRDRGRLCQIGIKKKQLSAQKTVSS